MVAAGLLLLTVLFQAVPLAWESSVETMRLRSATEQGSSHTPRPTATPVKALSEEEANRMMLSHMDAARLVPKSRSISLSEFEDFMREAALVDFRNLFLRVYEGSGYHQTVDDPTGRLVWRMCRDGRIYAGVSWYTAYVCLRFFAERDGLQTTWLEGPDGTGFYAVSLAVGERLTMELVPWVIPELSYAEAGRRPNGILMAIGTARPEYDERCEKKTDLSFQELMRQGHPAARDELLRRMGEVPQAMRDFLTNARYIVLETSGIAGDDRRIEWLDGACTRLSWVGPGLVAWVAAGQSYAGPMEVIDEFDPRQRYPTRGPMEVAGAFPPTPTPTVFVPIREPIEVDEQPPSVAPVFPARERRGGGLLSFLMLGAIVLLLGIGAAISYRIGKSGSGEG